MQSHKKDTSVSSFFISTYIPITNTVVVREISFIPFSSRLRLFLENIETNGYRGGDSDRYVNLGVSRSVQNIVVSLSESCKITAGNCFRIIMKKDRVVFLLFCLYF